MKKQETVHRPRRRLQPVVSCVHKFKEYVLVFHTDCSKPAYEAKETECGVEVRRDNQRIVLTEKDSLVTCKRCKKRLAANAEVSRAHDKA